MQVILIVLICIFILILIGVNVYLLILYIHVDDKGLGNVVYTKILVIIGLVLAQAQALMVPLDVANRSAIENDSLDMQAFWFFLYIVVLIFIALLIPYAIFFYETDHDDHICKRLGLSLLYTIGTLIFTCLVLFVSWVIFRWVDMDVKLIQLKPTDTFSGTIITPTTAQNQFTFQVNLGVYIAVIISFFGWILVVIFGGVGLSALPIDMINQFRYRPRARKSAQMTRIKDRLSNMIAEMIKEGQQLKKEDEQNMKNQEAGWFQKFKSQRRVNNQMSEFKVKYFALSEQFKIFNMELQMQSTNPIIPCLKLLLGIFFFITTLLWVIQIIFGNLAKGDFGRPLIPFLNQLFIFMEENNVGFISTAIFAYFCLYLVWCVQKGNIKFGMSLPVCCRFHPMKENQTWMNSFMFNVILLLIASVGIIQLCISSFPTYTRNTEIYLIFGVQIQYMRFYNFFYKNGIFPIALLIWFGLSFIIQLVMCKVKPKHLKEIQKVRNQQEQ